MRLLPILLLLFWGADAGAQEVLERSVGLEMQPHANLRRVSGLENTTIQELRAIDSLESGTFGYGLGLVYESRVDRIGFTTGLRYTRAGYAVDGGPREGEVVAHYLGLPIEANFYQNISDRNRMFFLLGAGIQAHLGTSVHAQTTPPADDSDYRSLIFSFNTGIGYDYKLSNDWALRLHPNFQFFLNGNVRPDVDTRANRNYYQIGLRLVVRRLFV